MWYDINHKRICAYMNYVYVYIYIYIYIYMYTHISYNVHTIHVGEGQRLLRCEGLHAGLHILGLKHGAVQRPDIGDKSSTYY